MKLNFMCGIRYESDKWAGDAEFEYWEFVGGLQDSGCRCSGYRVARDIPFELGTLEKSHFERAGVGTNL